MAQKTFRDPTDIERSFLRIASRGHAEIERQIESCRVADYDPTGWCDVLVLTGPPSPIRFHADGPALRRGDSEYPDLFVQTMLNVNEAGMLESVEIVHYAGTMPATPYGLFVEAAHRNELVYPDLSGGT